MPDNDNEMTEFVRKLFPQDVTDPDTPDPAELRRRGDVVPDAHKTPTPDPDNDARSFARRLFGYNN